MADPRIEIFQGDITGLQVDAIVNAANSRLAPGAGVCGAIHRGAGPELARECAAIGGCPTGEARITGGYDLPAKHVIHTVGPVWHEGDDDEEPLLARCYDRALALAAENGLRSVAFPAISTGVYGFPKRRAAEIAVERTVAFLEGNGEMERVVFACFDSETHDIYRELLDGLKD